MTKRGLVVVHEASEALTLDQKITISENLQWCKRILIYKKPKKTRQANMSKFVKLPVTSVDYSSGKHLHCFLFECQEDIDLNQHKADVGDIVKRSI